MVLGVVVVVVDVVVVVGRGRVVVVVGGRGRVVGAGPGVGGAGEGGVESPGAGLVVVLVARRARRLAASWYQNATVGSTVVVVVGPAIVVEVVAVDEVVVDREAVRGLVRATWMPRTSVAPTAKPSRHFETPTTPSAISRTISNPLRMRSSGL